MMKIQNSKIYPWIVVGLLWMVALLNYLDRQMLSTLQSSMQIDITELAVAENFGRLMGIFLLIYGLVSPFAGAIADRINRKWLIVGSLFTWSTVTYGMGIAQTFEQVYWLRAFMGVSEALYIPAGLAMIADYHSDKTRSLAVGIHMTGLYAGQALGDLERLLRLLTHGIPFFTGSGLLVFYMRYYWCFSFMKRRDMGMRLLFRKQIRA